MEGKGGGLRRGSREVLRGDAIFRGVGVISGGLAIPQSKTKDSDSYGPCLFLDVCVQF